ncbi:hypothetical protein BRARA_C02869 [Brassica rapa]|uniref:Uncharacterized protein n=1 Tax=Brassica campestris TaxID=3711 RepID=A0A397ZZA0_BRACM|nr:hypothetical protein BRARA_C02869 [Brassica rapa]
MDLVIKFLLCELSICGKLYIFLMRIYACMMQGSILYENLRMSDYNTLSSFMRSMCDIIFCIMSKNSCNSYSYFAFFGI